MLGDDGRLTIHIQYRPKLGAEARIIGHCHAIGDLKALSAVAENNLLASLTGNHKLDVVPGVEYETSGFQKDHRSRSFLKRSAGADDGHLPGFGACGRALGTAPSPAE